MSRDVIGTLLSATQAGVTRTYGHDSHLFLTSIAEPEVGTTTFGRDAVGNMSAKTVGTVATNFTYDGLDRLATIVNSDTAGTVAFTYDGRSKVTRVTNPVATRDYTYDLNGNLKEDKLTVDANVFTVDYTYDLIDGLSSISYPLTKGTVSLSPDTRGRPTQVSPYLTSVAYFGSGNLNSITYGNGVVTSFAENARQLPSSISSAGIQLGLTYSYDGAGNVMSIANSYFGSESRTLAYDSVDRLTSASGPWGSGVIGYDGAGNIASQQLGSYSIAYAYSSNRLIGISGSRSMSFSYDGRGNITGNGQSAFTFDNASQLTCANCGTPSEVHYGYDGQGRRVWEQKNGNKTYFVQAPNGDLQFEYTPYGRIWTKHAYLNGKRIASETDSDATPTTTTLTASPSSATYASVITLTASVTAGGTGSVEFRDSGQVLGTATLNAGQATLTVSTLAGGSHSITANYLGDADRQASSSAATSVVITKRSSTTSLSASPTSGALGTRTTLTATVTGTSPSGSVQFNDGAATIATVSLTNGSASFLTAALAGGTHSFSASYLGDTNHLTSASASVNVAIAQSAPAVSVSSSNLNAPVGAAITFTASVTGVSGITPTGSVSFLDAATTLATSTLSGGSATFITNGLSVGTHPISVSYAGDASYTSGTSSTMSQVITSRVTSTSTLSIASRPYYLNQLIAMTVAVTGSSPTGTVHMKSDGVEVASSGVIAGAATVRVQLAAGAHSVQATYDGDANNLPSTSNTVNVTVARGQQPQDFNLDAKTDLLWFRPLDRATMTWQMNGNVIDLNSPTFGQGATSTELMRAGDFDSDGKTDLLWLRDSDRMFSVQLSNTGPQQNIGTNTADWSLRGVGDFDGDGKDDLLWFNTTDRRAMTWTLNGAQLVTSTIVNADGGAGYEAIAAADFNGDGKADILWFRASDRMVKIQLTGGGTVEVGQGTAGWELRAIADVNGDGRADIVWFNPADRSVTVWLMNGVQLLATQPSPAGPTGYQVIGAGDFNADGNADILWYRASDRMLSLQFTGGAWADIGTADDGFYLRGVGQPIIGSPTTPSITLGSTANPSTVGQYVTYTGVVLGASGTATGTISFRDNGAVISGCDLLAMTNGRASCTIGNQALGTHSMTAIYSGDSSYLGVTSSTLPQVVNPAKPYTPSITLGSSVNPSTVGQYVELTAVVSGSAGTPTGTIVYLDNGDTIAGCGGLQMTGGQTTCTYGGFSQGTHSVTTVYSGDANYNGVTSSTLPQTVDPAKPNTPSITLGSSLNPSTAGQVVTFTAVLSGPAGTPTGNVVFRDNGVTIAGCGGLALTNGSVSCAPPLSTVGTHPITAIYLGDANYNGITSGTLPQTVQ